MDRQKKVAVGITSIFFLISGAAFLFIFSKIVPATDNNLNNNSNKFVSAVPAEQKTVISGPAKNRENENGKKLFERVTYDQKFAVNFLKKNPKWKQSLPEFIEFISADIEKNGFNSLVANLNEAEWATLFNFLKETKNPDLESKKNHAK